MTDSIFTRGALPLSLAALTATGILSASPTLAASATRHYTGPVAQQNRWGPIQVTITVKNKRITNVSAAVSPDNPRSSFIETNALPQLKQEVLRGQTASIQLVSGATDTSEGYATSLQAAVKKAIKARTLPVKDL